MKTIEKKKPQLKKEILTQKQKAIARLRIKNLELDKPLTGGEMKTVEKKPRTKLSVKQKRFVAEYVKDGNGAQAALKAYNTKNNLTARVIASENLTKPYIVNAIAEALPDELLSQRHLELLNKREVATYRNPDGTFEKEIIDQPDTQAVSKGLDMAYKIKGTYAPEKQAIVHAFVIADEDKARIDNILNDNE